VGLGVGFAIGVGLTTLSSDEHEELMLLHMRPLCRSGLEAVALEDRVAEMRRVLSKADRALVVVAVMEVEVAYARTVCVA
jgi:hypothetical protein